MNEYPTIEGARFVDELVQSLRRRRGAASRWAEFDGALTLAGGRYVEIKFDDRDASEADPAATASAAATAAAADATAPEVEDVELAGFRTGDPTESDLDDLFPREETTPDRLWLLRRRREAAGGAANWSVTRTSDDWEPPRRNSDLLGDEGPAKPGDVSLGVFALFGDSRPAALRPAPSKVGAVGDALSAVLNRIVRPAAALLALAWAPLIRALASR
ncbi:hypothetical protein JL721_13104 [Aureococcus anophagefferens]|nr:hypothetical protein JL721_13104 [Aureococcus anophagefferens]